MMAASPPLLVALALGAAPRVALAPPVQGPPQPLGFVTRRGAQLLDGGRPFRFAGPNVPWLGLDENLMVNGTHVEKINYPTHFRVDDAFETAVGMGATVIRSHTIGISVANALSLEPALGSFSETASEHIDYAVWRAAQSGVRLIVPLTDNWDWYHGAKVSFVRWIDPRMDHADACAPPLSGNESVAGLCPFYSDRRLIDAFKAYIGRLLSHVNGYTGRALKDEPAILGWVSACPRWVQPETAERSEVSGLGRRRRATSSSA